MTAGLPRSREWRERSHSFFVANSSLSHVADVCIGSGICIVRGRVYDINA
jgi:hypothetical protein